jgi:glycosyltransferase involved in cell wall biosynthesis
MVRPRRLLHASAPTSRLAKTCLHVPPGDSGALAAALADIWESEGLAARLGAAGRLRFDEQFTREVMVARMVSWYEGLLARGRGAGGGR